MQKTNKNMGWSIGYDNNWKRDIGYGVPAVCDAPKCDEEIDRGLAFVCGDDPYGGEFGCGLYFCHEYKHFSRRKPHGARRTHQLCTRCFAYKIPYSAKPDVEEWIQHKLIHESWTEWRKNNPDEVKELQRKTPHKLRAR